MITNEAFWRHLREDFESLPPGEFILTWHSQAPRDFKGARHGHRWVWWHFPDESLRARFCAIALRGAKALGYESEDGWFDRLREADFVKFRLSGQSLEKQSDGSMLEVSDGSLHDLVKQSITLCYVLEAEGIESSTRDSDDGRIVEKRRSSEPGFPRLDPKTKSHDGGANWAELQWTDIEVKFISDERVQISGGGRTETCNYAEMGFADGRIGGGNAKPNLAWVTLRAMAEENGITRNGAKASKAWTQVEKSIQASRKRLRDYFGIAGDPIPFVEGTGYQAVFKIRCGPSFNS